MDVAQHEAAEAEAHKAAHSGIISDLRNGSPLGRLGIGEVRAVLHRMAERGYTIIKAANVAEAKAGLAALPVSDPADVRPPVSEGSPDRAHLRADRQ